MSEILSQSQIDALLNSLQNDGSPLKEHLKTEVNENEYRKYDFYSPKKFTKDKLRLLENIYDNYTRIVTSQINSLFRTNSIVTVLSVEEQRYYEFCNALSDNDVLSIIDVKLKEYPKNMPILLHVKTALMLTMIDRMLGGSGEEEIEDESYTYTEIELALYKRIMQYLVTPMMNAWNNYIDVELEFERVEENSAMFHGFRVDETVIILVLGVEMGKVKEKITICISGNLLMNLFSVLGEKQYFVIENEEERKANQEEIMDSLRESLLGLTAQLGVIELNMNDIYNLNIGDVIDLGKPKDSSVCVFVEGKPWFLGKMGRHNKNMAVLLEKRIGKEETELDLEETEEFEERI